MRDSLRVLTRGSSRRRYHQHERSTDFPARAVRFPDTADLSNVKASYVNGVLKLEVRACAWPASVASDLRLPSPRSRRLTMLDCGY